MAKKKPAKKLTPAEIKEINAEGANEEKIAGLDPGTIESVVKAIPPKKRGKKITAPEAVAVAVAVNKRGRKKVTPAQVAEIAAEIAEEPATKKKGRGAKKGKGTNDKALEVLASLGCKEFGPVESIKIKGKIFEALVSKKTFKIESPLMQAYIKDRPMFKRLGIKPWKRGANTWGVYVKINKNDFSM